AADALGKNSGGRIARHIDRAVVDDMDRVAKAAGAAATADRDANGESLRCLCLGALSDAELGDKRHAAIATTAANALRLDAVGAELCRVDDAADVVGYVDGTRVIAASAAPSDRNAEYPM